MNFEIGKLLILGGVILIVLGLLLLFAPHLPWLGKLPGDILIKKENFKFYLPITTCILISLLLTLLFNFFRK
jgi:hypothetical protein